MQRMSRPAVPKFDRQLCRRSSSSCFFLVGLTAFLCRQLYRQKIEIRELLKQIDTKCKRTVPAVRSLTELLADIANASAQSGDSEYLLAKRLDRILSSPRGEGRSVKDAFIQLADLYSAGLLSHLKQHYADLTPNEIALCGMILLGIEPACISKVFGYDHVQTFYNKRKTIRRKMHLAHGIPLEGFLKDLSARIRHETEERIRELVYKY